MVLEFLLGLVHTFGYLGVFAGSLIGSASVILPLPSFLFIFLAGKILNPVGVAIAASLGGAIGELTSYAVGRGIAYGKKKVARRKQKQPPKQDSFWRKRIKKWFQGRYGFWALILFAATPLPDDIIGIYCGAIGYNIKKFFIATLIGKFILCLILAYAGLYGLGVFAEYFT